jgi:hypothetical protein
MRHPPLSWVASLATVAILCATLLAGCWSGPERPGILVNTTPPGASCILSRLGQPIATAEPTPAIALVDPGDGEITILCRRPGFADAAVALPAHNTQPGVGFPFGSPASEYQPRVDIALTAKPHSPVPLTGR